MQSPLSGGRLPRGRSAAPASRDQPDATTAQRTCAAPLDPAFAALLPEEGLQTGTSYTVSSSPSLVLALLSAASQKGLWCAVVGMPTLGVEAAAAFGIDLARLILVPTPETAGWRRPPPWPRSCP